MNVLELTDSDFADRIIAEQDGVLLFHKERCPHCLNMKKVIEKFIAKGNENLAVMFINSEENPKAMQQLSVERVPTLLIIKKGRVATTHVGLMNPRQLAAMFENA